MKAKLFLGAVIIACLCLSACSRQGGYSGSHSAPASEEPSVELTEEDLTSLQEYAVSFAEYFDEPFSSVDELSYQAIGHNSLYWLVVGEGYESFETNDAGFPYIPKPLLQSYVLDHFGIENYEYPVSENPNIWPRYDPDKDAYLFSEARGGPRYGVSVLSETVAGETITYTMEFEISDFETGEIIGTQKMEYRFQIIPAAGGYVLRALSAAQI